VLLTQPAAIGFKKVVSNLFPVFSVSRQTLALQVLCALTVALFAAVIPAIRSARVRIVEGLRAIG